MHRKKKQRKRRTEKREKKKRQNIRALKTRRTKKGTKLNQRTTSHPHLQNGRLIDSLPVDEGISIARTRGNRDNTLRVGDDAVTGLDGRAEELQGLTARVRAAVRAHLRHVKM